ncbi:MAG: type II toxin-antitoxin system RelB/DinJ family antitoxin [Candidatus Peribacteraceae bacterium]|nr:type II toxin-antitoxin system RelB/DinJ family antitoxin [Candidatus Peribacteraceae bacterium]
MTKQASSNLHIRIPAKLMREAKQVIEALGLDTSSAIRLFFMQLAIQQTLPFSLPKLKPMSQKTKKVIADSLADEDVLGPFSNPDQALKALYAAA